MILSNVISKDLPISFSKTARALNGALYGINKKVQQTAHLFFNYIRQAIKAVEALFWSERKVEAREQDNLGFFQWILEEAFINGENKKEPTEELAVVEVNKPMTYVCELAMVAAPIYLSVNAQFSGTFSFMREQLTLQTETEALKLSIASFFGATLDPTQLKSHYMTLNSSDPIDHAVYQFGVLSIATLTHAVTGNLFSLPLHPIFTFIAAMPPIENTMMSLKFPQLIAKKAHEMHSKARGAAIGFIEPYVARLIKPKLISLAEKGDKKIKKKLGASDVDLGRFGNRLVKAAVHQHVIKPAAELTAKAIDATTTKIAEGIVDLCVQRVQNVGMTALQVGVMDKAMKAAYMQYPLLGGLSWVIAGGVKQPMDQLALRVTGAALFIITGQTVWPIIFVYGPRMVNYFIELKKNYDSVEARESKPVKKEIPVDESTKNIPSLSQQSKNKESIKQKKAPVNDGNIDIAAAGMMTGAKKLAHLVPINDGNIDIAAAAGMTGAKKSAYLAPVNDGNIDIAAVGMTCLEE